MYLHIIQIFLNAIITTLCDHDNVYYLLNYQSCQPVYIYALVSVGSQDLSVHIQGTLIVIFKVVSSCYILAS